MNTQEYSTSEVASYAQCTLRQLQWWDERRVVMPRHEGHRRIYSFQQAVEVQILAELRRKQLSLQAIRRHMRVIQKQVREISTDLSTPLYLVTSGKSVMIKTDPAHVLSYAAAAPSGLIIVDIGAIVRRLTTC